MKRVTRRFQEEDSGSDFECFIELSEEDLALEFVKLSASDKIRYSEWFDFHTKYQQSTGIGGSVSQIIRNISNQNKSLIPEEIPRREFEDVDINPDIKTRPGGTQYQSLKKEDVKVKTEPRGIQGHILRGRGRGRMTLLT